MKEELEMMREDRENGELPARRHDALSRRSVVAASAWAVPAVVLSTAVPAYATSPSDRVTLDAGGQNVPARGAFDLTATVTDAAGAPRAGRSVTFAGPSKSIISPATAVTDTSGVASARADLDSTWTVPGSSVSFTAISSSVTTSRTFTVLGANAYGVGRNDSGQVGDGTTSNTLVPVQLALVFTSPVRQIASGGGFTLALLENGTVWGVGSNGSGQLGDGTQTSRSTWAQIPELSGVSEIAVGSGTAFARVGDAVYAWGRNNTGQLGDGTQTSALSPTAIPSLGSGVAHIAAAGSSAFAVTAGGAVLSWGLNNFGQLGDGTTTARSTPTSVSGLSSGVTSVEAGQLSCFALVGGSVMAWGYGLDGQLGDTASVHRRTPVMVARLSGVVQIAASTSTAYALTSDGAAYAWGRNDKGQIGDGTTTNRSSPVNVSGLTAGVSAVAGGSNGGCALVGGAVKAWGDNAYGQLGDGTTTTRLTPVTVTGVSNVEALVRSHGAAGSAFWLR